jgi:predicted nucleotidyltransferase component of viral defense system
MIPRAHITAWRRHAPWSTDAQVEQDLVLSRVLVEIYSDPLLAVSLAFRGGTALHKLYLNPPSRYSEDIDLVQVKADAIGPMINALRGRLDSWLGEPRRRQSEGRMTMIYRFESEIPPVTPLRLKVEVNTREHFSVLGLIRKPVAVVNPWFDGASHLLTYELEELLGTKLRAFFQRKKGRDLFDLATALTCCPDLDAAKVVRCFERYMAASGARVSRAEFEANLADKLADPAFRADVMPLLTREINHGTGFDVMRAAEAVHRSLLSRLSGAPWKGPHGRRSEE